MGNDIFGNLGGGLGGLMKGLSGFMPEDDPAAQMLSAQGDVSSLKQKESSLYEQIGRKALSLYGEAPFEELCNELKLVQSNLAAAEEKLHVAKSEQDAKEKAENQARQARTCPSCGFENPEGTSFCQECGTKLMPSVAMHCSSCGAELEPGTRFCGICGAKQPE